MIVPSEKKHFSELLRKAVKNLLPLGLGPARQAVNAGREGCDQPGMIAGIAEGGRARV